MLGERWNGDNGGVLRVLLEEAFAAVPGRTNPAFSRCSVKEFLFNKCNWGGGVASYHHSSQGQKRSAVVPHISLHHPAEC